MNFFSHLAILFTVFLVMIGIAELIPDLFKAYRGRYKSSVLRTSRELDRFFVNIKPTNIFIGAGVLGVLLGWLTRSWVVALVVAGGGLFAPKLILAVWRNIRSAKLDLQLLDGLILINNSLKSGLDIAAGIERVSTSMKPPISEEFGLVINAYRLGTPLEEALMELTTRIRSRSLETVVYAIGIQRETGGNIIRTFDQLIETIREEGKLQKKVQAMTSQGRTQIIFLAAFPWVLAIGFYFLSPDFMAPALANPVGQIVVVGLLIWEVVGIMVTRKIVTVDI